MGEGGDGGEAGCLVLGFDVCGSSLLVLTDFFDELFGVFDDSSLEFCSFCSDGIGLVGFGWSEVVCESCEVSCFFLECSEDEEFSHRWYEVFWA